MKKSKRRTFRQAGSNDDGDSHVALPLDAASPSAAPPPIEQTPKKRRATLRAEFSVPPPPPIEELPKKKRATLRPAFSVPPPRDDRSGQPRPAQDGPQEVDRLGVVPKKGVPVPIAETTVPRLLMSVMQIGKLRLDHRTGFLLANIDGRTNVLTLIDVASMKRVEVERILRELIALGVVSLAPK